MQWPLLDALPEEDRRQLLSRAHRRKYARQEVIFHEGDSGDSLHLIAKGHVALRMHTPLGDVATVRIARSGEHFGELAVVKPAPRNATAVAIGQVETVVIDRALLDALRAEHAHVTELLLAALVAEIRRLASQVVEAMYVPVETRLWRRVHDLSLTFGSDVEPAKEIPLTQELIAQLTGCTRPTANRALRAGEDAGIIRMARGRIEILDFEAVRRRAR